MLLTKESTDLDPTPNKDVETERYLLGMIGASTDRRNECNGQEGWTEPDEQPHQETDEEGKGGKPYQKLTWRINAPKKESSKRPHDRMNPQD